jgi:serine/threonine protein phosphatase PrpC
VAARASIVGAAETNVGKVRNHNEDCHFLDPERGIFVVCDGMGGHAAGEVASALAVQTVRDNWLSATTQALAEQWLSHGTAEAHRRMMAAIHDGARAAHEAILAEATRDRTKGGMGTTLVGAILVGGEMVFAHCGDSRAYLVRDGIAMQLTEDHTLLARLLAAGVDVDVHGDGSRFKSMLTNALGIGQDCKVGTFVVPLADGDRFLLCSDGITEYLPEPEIGEVLCSQPSPALAAQRLVELALERGGGDNATAVVVRVLEAGESARPAGLRRKEEAAVDACPLWSKITPQQRLRALRIALPRDHATDERIAALALGDRVSWIIVDGEVEQEGVRLGPGALLYPQALLVDRPLPDRDGLAVARGEVRTLAIRADDFRELCDDDAELGEALLDALGVELASRTQPLAMRRSGPVVQREVDDQRTPAPTIRIEPLINGAAVPMPADDGQGLRGVVVLGPDEPEEPEIEMITEPEPEVAAAVAVVAAVEPAQKMRPFGRRASTERLILKHEERAAVAADLEDALTKLTLEQDPGEHDEAPAEQRSPPPTEPRVHAEVSARHRSPPALQVVNGGPRFDPEPPPPDAPGEEPEEIVMTVQDESARIVEVVQDDSSQTLTLTVEE